MEFNRGWIPSWGSLDQPFHMTGKSPFPDANGGRASSVVGKFHRVVQSKQNPDYLFQMKWKFGE